MPSTAAHQLNRIVALVAELARRERDGLPEATLAELAVRHGVPPDQIAADLRALTMLGDDADADWLLSLRVTQERDRVSVTSAGAYRRPIRLTPDELLALRVALAGEDAAGVLAKLRTLDAEPAEPVDARVTVGTGVGSEAGAVHGLFARAIFEHRCVEILYTSDGAPGVARRVHPYQLVSHEGHVYLVAWCERSNGWRRFRTDRVLDALPTADTFAPRPDFTPVTDPADVFLEPDAGVDEVRVRFSPHVSRWIRERYPEATAAADGSVHVAFRVASPHWLVRHVLQYGAEAEVLEPPAYRDAVRRAVAR